MEGMDDPVALQRYCKEKCGLVLASGSANSRASHSGSPIWGMSTPPMILGMLGVVEVALNASGISHGRGGVRAAIGWLVKP